MVQLFLEEQRLFRSFVCGEDSAILLSNVCGCDGEDLLLSPIIFYLMHMSMIILGYVTAFGRESL